ncbi:hypothetical protein IWQ60_004815 [Tieghemiomyces parasiticus]|uniref:Maf-like protein n=1 Tax=Tieghemiomyces parasiticus TaxID=78921 RepID=A0A9W8AFL3_9FUNG|nr:hypothetical protein IWQ60_004815 [Tieghemiomyces parasiticus]
MTSLSVPFLTDLQRQYRIVLASGSPRRLDILRNLGIEFEVVVSSFPEDLEKAHFQHPGDYVAENAYRKALDVSERLNAAFQPGDRPYLIIGADTIVYANGCILEKPVDEAAALATLCSYRDHPHHVVTALCLLGGPFPPDQLPAAPSVPSAPTDATVADPIAIGASRPMWQVRSDSTCFSYCATETTQVTFDADIPEEALRAYVATGEPMDKAGAYGYQGLAAFFVSGIQGDYYNVVGFPSHLFFTMLHRMAKAAGWP